MVSEAGPIAASEAGQGNALCFSHLNHKTRASEGLILQRETLKESRGMTSPNPNVAASGTESNVEGGPAKEDIVQAPPHPPSFSPKREAVRSQ